MTVISHTVQTALNSVEAIEIARQDLKEKQADLGCVLSVLFDESSNAWNLSFEINS